MLKRLSSPTGAIDSAKRSSDTADSVVREAILVHAGPENSDMEFDSASGPIKFSPARIQNVVKVHNAHLDKLAADYGGEDKIPVGAYEPILDSHENDSNDRIVGRLTGRLEFQIRDVPKVGKNVPCAVARPGVTFIGTENVKKANDGRIYHLSIGIREEDDSLGEISTVVVPAAPGAMLLSAKGGNPTNSTGGKSKMSAELKKLKAAHEARLTKMTAIKALSTNLKSKASATSDLVKLTARKSTVLKTLSGLVAAGKMTPAEYRNMVSADDLTHLAKLDDATMKIALKPYESREKPVIQPGQRGTADALDFAQLSEGMKKKELTKLTSETKRDLIKMGAKVKMSAEEEAAEKEKKLAAVPGAEPVNPGKDPHAVPGSAGDEKQLAAHHMALKACLEKGDVQGAKDVHEQIMGMAGVKHMSEFAGDVKGEDQEKSMKDQQTQIDELSTELARMHGMMEELIGAEEQEGHDLEAGGAAKDPKDGEPAAAAS